MGKTWGLDSAVVCGNCVVNESGQIWGMGLGGQGFVIVLLERLSEGFFCTQGRGWAVSRSPRLRAGR